MAELLAPGAFTDGVPHRLFDELRAEDPVLWWEEPAGSAWVVTGHPELEEISRDPAHFSNSLGSIAVTPVDDARLAHYLRTNLLGMDPPAHSKLRRVVSQSFTPRSVNRLEAGLRRHMRTFLDKVRAEPGFDLVLDLAGALPAAAICDLLGVPEADRPRVMHSVGEFSRAVQLGDMETMRANAEPLFAYAEELGRTRRADPADDVTTGLVNGRIDGRSLDESEYDNFFLLLLIAGTGTTKNVFSNGVLAFLDRPDDVRALVEDPSLVPSAVEEVLRCFPPAVVHGRTVVEDLEFEGREMRAGQRVGLYFAAANRDPRIFRDPHRFDIRRDPNPHVSFGAGGTHFCLGAALARLEARVFLEELLPDMHRLRLDGPVQRGTFSNLDDAVEHVPVVWDPALSSHHRVLQMP